MPKIHYSGNINLVVAGIPLADDVSGDLVWSGNHVGGALIGTSGLAYPFGLTVDQTGSVSSAYFSLIFPTSLFPLPSDTVTRVTWVGTVSTNALDLILIGTAEADPSNVVGNLLAQKVVIPIDMGSVSSSSEVIDTTPVELLEVSPVHPGTNRNAFDGWGQLIGVSRIPGESTPDYFDRLHMRAQYPTHAGYPGYLNSLVQDLGFEHYGAVRLDWSGYEPSGRPRVICDGVRLLLYSDYLDDDHRILDLDIDLRKLQDTQALVDKINQESKVFSATLLKKGSTPAFLLKTQDNWQWEQEDLLVTTRRKLKRANLIRSLVFFADREAFRIEFEDETALMAQGDFKIDYDSGAIFSISPPRYRSRILYRWWEFPYTLLAADVGVVPIWYPNFQDHIFPAGLPTAFGLELVRELIKASPAFWGS